MPVQPILTPPMQSSRSLSVFETCGKRDDAPRYAMHLYNIDWLFFGPLSIILVFALILFALRP